MKLLIGLTVVVLIIGIVTIIFLAYDTISDIVERKRKREETNAGAQFVSRYCDTHNVPLDTERKARTMVEKGYPMRKVRGFLNDEYIRNRLLTKELMKTLKPNCNEEKERGMKNYIVLIVGKSGSGKSMLCRYMRETYGLKEVKSYTTRQRRNLYDDTHIFITKEKFEELDNLCAVTDYNGEFYGATREQVDEADLYVIDVAGVDYFFKHYDGKKIPMVIYIDSDEDVRESRMLLRGDPQWKVHGRLIHDKEAFKDVEDYAVETYVNNSESISRIQDIAREIYGKYFE